MSLAILWCVLHGVVAFMGTLLVRAYALRRKLLDQPGERRNHTVATPRGGGMAIVVAILAGCAAAIALWPAAGIEITGCACALAMVAGVGWWDDHRPLSARLRLLVHFAASAILGWLSYRMNSQMRDAVLAVLISMVLINIWNFMDGINGLATSQALLGALAYAWILPTPFSLAALGLAAACAGFLPLNFPKARIFLGDSGSGALGFCLAVLLILSLHNGLAGWWINWIPLTAFAVDAGFTLFFRMLAGQRWWEAHSQHLYQVMVRKLGSHMAVTNVYFFFSALAVALFLVLWKLEPVGRIPVVVAWCALSVVLWLNLRRWLRK